MKPQLLQQHLQLHNKFCYQTLLLSRTTLLVMQFFHYQIHFQIREDRVKHSL